MEAEQKIKLELTCCEWDVFRWVEEFPEGRALIIDISGIGNGDSFVDFVRDLVIHSRTIGFIGNNCYHIAKGALGSGLASGKLFSRAGNQDFVGYDNHWVNFRNLQDLVAVFDLTAKQILGDIDVLVIRGENFSNLTGFMKALYGGIWEARGDV